MSPGEPGRQPRRLPPKSVREGWASEEIQAPLRGQLGPVWTRVRPWKAGCPDSTERRKRDPYAIRPQGLEAYTPCPPGPAWTPGRPRKPVCPAPVQTRNQDPSTARARGPMLDKSPPLRSTAPSVDERDSFPMTSGTRVGEEDALLPNQNPV